MPGIDCNNSFTLSETGFVGLVMGSKGNALGWGATSGVRGGVVDSGAGSAIVFGVAIGSGWGSSQVTSGSPNRMGGSSSEALETC